MANACRKRYGPPQRWHLACISISVIDRKIECNLALWPALDSSQVPRLTWKNLTRAALGSLIPPPWSNLRVSWRPFTNAAHILCLATSTYFHHYWYISQSLSWHSHYFPFHLLILYLWSPVLSLSPSGFITFIVYPFNFHFIVILIHFHFFLKVHLADHLLATGRRGQKSEMVLTTLSWAKTSS